MPSEDELKELRQIINDQIEEVQEEIVELEKLTKPIAPDKAIGRLSRMDAINNRAINEQALRKDKKKLQKLERAQERIEKGDFGMCKICGDPIPAGRLKFMPWTTRYVKCV